MNRLETAQEMNGTTNNWKQQFSYDACGNRRIDVNPAHTTPELVGTNPDISPQTNRIVARAGESYHYDAAGNLDRDAVNNSYTYDAENRQVSYNGGAGVNGGTSYSYDGEGRRVKKVTPIGVTIFVYNVLGQVVAEYSSEQQVTSNGTSYLTLDTLGSTRVVTDSNGQVRARKDYLPFGEKLKMGGRAGVKGYSQEAVRQQFTGYDREHETGLDYAQARYYASAQGRFTSADPLMTSVRPAIPQSWNRYSYCLNNPLVYSDPNGMDWYTKNTGDGHPEWHKDNPGDGYTKFDKLVYYAGDRGWVGLDPLSAAWKDHFETAEGATAYVQDLTPSIGACGSDCQKAIANTMGRRAMQEGGIDMMPGQFLHVALIASPFFKGIGGVSTTAATSEGLDASISSTFAGEATRKVLQEDLFTTRVFSNINGVVGRGSGISGQFFTTETITSSVQATRVLSLAPEFNEASFVVRAVIPRGTTVFTGRAAPLFGQSGGGTQIFVPNPTNVRFFGIRPLR